MSATVAASPPTLCQVVALTLTYRKIVLVWAMAPLLMLLSPVLLNAVVLVLDLVTAGFGVLSILLFVIGKMAAHDLIHRCLAATSKKESLSLSKNQVRLSFIVFVGSCLAARFLVGPLLHWLGLSLSWSPDNMTSSLTRFLRLSLALALLGLSVCARYVGPKSIMRCSSVPLVTNPLDESILYLLQNPSSILEPTSDTPSGELLLAPPLLFSSRWSRGRRFHHPTWWSILAQILVSVIIGTLVASTTVFGGWVISRRREDEDDDFARCAIVLTCNLTILGSLMTTALNFSFSHELDPRRYLSPSTTWAFTALASTVPRISFFGISIPVVSMVAAFFSTSNDIEGVVGLFAKLAVATWLMGFYLIALDEAIRTMLFNPTLDLKRLVDELYDERTLGATVDVIMQSLLYDPSLVKDVWKPTQKPGLVDLDGEELRRCDRFSKQLASLLLSRPSGVVEAPLEEDILRVAILKFLGGSLLKSLSSSQQLAQDEKSREQSEPRHVENSFISKLSIGGKSREPLSVPLIRALCVFIGGLGEALVLCSKPIPGSIPAGRHHAVERWWLAPGFLVCAEYAVTATSRCIVQSMTVSGRAIVDWRSTHISIMVPAALKSIFCLRKGLVAFGQYLASQQGHHTLEPDTKAAVADKIGIHSPDLLFLMRVCDKAGASIMHSLHSPKGLGRIDLRLVDEDCLLWAKQLT